MKRLVRTALSLTAVVALVVGCNPPEITSARIYINNQDYVNARKSLEQAIVTYPDNAEAFRLLGDVDMQERKWAQAYEHYTRSATLNPTLKQYVQTKLMGEWVNHFNNSLAMANRGELDEAYRLAEVCTVLQPDDPRGWGNLGYIHNQRGENDQAVEMYEKVLTLKPDDLNIRKNVALVYFNQRRYDKAIAYLEILTQDDLSDAVVISTLGMSYVQVEAKSKAIDLYRRALEQNPEHADLVWDLAVFYYQDQNMEEALPYLLQTIQMDPFNGVAMRLIGTEYFATDQGERAIPYLEKTVELRPEDADTWEMLGVCYVQKGARDENIDLIKRGQQYIEKAKAIKELLAKDPPPRH